MTMTFGLVLFLLLVTALALFFLSGNSEGWRAPTVVEVAQDDAFRDPQHLGMH